MACYCYQHCHYRGRVIQVYLRYGIQLGPLEVVRGKPLKFTPRDKDRVWKLLTKDGRCCGEYCGEIVRDRDHSP